MKYLLWLLIGLAVYHWIKRGNQLAARRDREAGISAETPAPGPARPAVAAEDMLQCAHCGIHIPASEAILAAPGQTYCSQAHRLLHAQG